MSDTLKRGTSNLKTTLKVPYCSACKKHDQLQWVSFWYQFLLLFLFIGVGIAFSAVFNVTIIIHLAFWILAVGLWVYIRRLIDRIFKLKVECLISEICVVDSVGLQSEMAPYFEAPYGRRGYTMSYNIRFSNDAFAKEFVAANRDNSSVLIK